RTVSAGEPEWLGIRPDDAIVDTNYQYDWDGELVGTSDKRRGMTRYEYDPVGQLIAMGPEKARAELFPYDPTRNPHEDGSEAEPREYGKGNRLLRKGDTDYRWDDDGRLIEQRTRAKSAEEEDLVWRYAWDSAGLLRSAEASDGRRVEFAYDPFARRVQ